MAHDFVFSAFVALTAWTLAFFVYKDRRERPLNRSLAGLLAAEGLLLVTLFHAGAPKTPYLEAAYLAVGIGAGWSVVIFGLLFLGCIRVPLTRPLGRRRMRRFLVFLLGAAWLHTCVLATYHLVTRSGIGAWANGMDIASGVTAILVSLLSLVVSVSALRRSPRGSLARVRARAYLFAFGVRDLSLLVGVGIGLALIPVWHGAGEAPAWAEAVSRGLPRMGSLTYCVALAAAILRVQVLEIGLRTRIRITRTTLSAAIFAGGTAALALVVLLADLSALWMALGLFVLAVPLHVFSLKVADRLAADLRMPAKIAERRRILELTAAEDERDLPRFVEEEELGRGGQGRAFRAWDRVLQRRVVVKERIAQGGQREAAMREARAAARVDHPNVVRLHDIEIDDRVRLIFEHVDGETLAARMASGKVIDAAHARRITRDVLAGLAAVHQAGLVHADIKPDNILLGIDGRARILDLGIAALRGSVTARGSRPFASPEQLAGRPLDPRADVYSLGVTLAFMVGGGPSSTLTGTDGLAGAPVPTVAHSRLAAVIARATHPARERRYADAGAMARALGTANTNLPTGLADR